LSSGFCFPVDLHVKETNIRRVFVDNTTSPVTFWVGSNHGASILKLEPLDSSGSN
jgi:hypothetical protein